MPLKRAIRHARKKGSLWVRLLDLARLVLTAEGRSILWTRVVRQDEVHQTTAYTRAERYPLLFELAAALAPRSNRILSFGCSTGEELLALRRRFGEAEIVGVEINARSRRLAARRVAADARTLVLDPRFLSGSFDVIFALSVLQREPHKIAQMDLQDLSCHYPYERFDAAIRLLADALVPGGLLCVVNAQYRIEDSSSGCQFEAIAQSAPMAEPLFAPDGRRFEGAIGRTIFRKVLVNPSS
jgi:SAM-dependent methyltransferase